jgi:hypothetical protein
VPRTSVGDDAVLVVAIVVDGARDRVPRVLDVVEVAPQVAILSDQRVVDLERTAPTRQTNKKLNESLDKMITQSEMFLIQLYEIRNCNIEVMALVF